MFGGFCCWSFFVCVLFCWGFFAEARLKISRQRSTKCRGCLKLHEIQCLAHLEDGIVVEVNGISGSLGIVIQESEVRNELKLWEKGLKLWLFN